MSWLGRFDDFNGMGAGESMKCGKMNPAKTISARTNNQIRLHVSSEKGPSGYCRIGDITNKMHTAAIIGIIIAKESPKSVISKKGNGSERHLLAVTLSDAPLSFTNVTCWGSSEYVTFLASEISIGDVVEIKGAHVQAKSNNSADEKFKPWTPCPCHLILSDSQGSIVPYTGPHASQYASILHVPTRASNDFYTLEDIQANGMGLQGEHINILAVLKKIWPVREIMSKSGRKTKKVDVVVCDETCASFNLTLWDSFVYLAETWIPFETVIFAADVRITFSDYHSSMVASTSSKTILTVDPDVPEAHSLRQFVINQSAYMFAENVFADTKDPDIESITNVLTVKGVKVLQKDVSSTGQLGYGVVYAFLSHLDIDGDVRTLLKDVCSRCRRRVNESAGYACSNPDCVAADLSHDDLTDVEYSVTVSLSDHTGSLEFCSLAPSVAEHVLGCKAKQFKNLTSTEKTQIKWTYLLERIKAVLKVRRAENRTDSRCYIRVLALEQANPGQVLEQGLTPS